MILILHIGVFYGVFVANIFKMAAQDSILDSTLTLAGALGAMFNGTSRIIWATLQDYWGFKKTYFILLMI